MESILRIKSLVSSLFVQIIICICLYGIIYLTKSNKCICHRGHVMESIFRITSLVSSLFVQIIICICLYGKIYLSNSNKCLCNRRSLSLIATKVYNYKYKYKYMFWCFRHYPQSQGIKGLCGDQNWLNNMLFM